VCVFFPYFMHVNSVVARYLEMGVPPRLVHYLIPVTIVQYRRQLYSGMWHRAVWYKYRRFRRVFCHRLQGWTGGCRFVWNANTLVPGYPLSQSTRLHSCPLRPWFNPSRLTLPTAFYYFIRLTWRKTPDLAACIWYLIKCDSDESRPVVCHS
jgi:hypothetical protein